jgi:LCP family protein required for cell wall assembly
MEGVMDKDLRELLILSVTIVIIFLSSLLIVGTQKDSTEDEESNIQIENQQDEEEIEDEEIQVEEVFHPDSFTGLLIGFDKARGLTEVVMVGYFDATDSEFKVISVPRDLHIDFRKEPFKTIKENDPKNRISYCKLGEVYSNLGKDNEALKQLKKIVGVIVGLEIDYMATIDVGGFREMVDAVGGVEFYVPQRMYYNDPLQDLYIDLQKGEQLLDGDKAEQLVRYRQYRMGDLQRIQVQQDFMVALYAKISQIRDFNKVAELATIGYNIFDSDFGLAFALDYAEYFFQMDKQDILKSENMVTLPSYGEKINDIWYQKWSLEEHHETVNELINKND